MRAIVYFDFIDDAERPLWYLLEFEQPLKWDKVLYFSPMAPFEKRESHEFDDYQTYATVTINDIMQSLYQDGHIGIDLPNIKIRLEKERYFTDHIKGLVIQISDIEDVMQYTS